MPFLFQIHVQYCTVVWKQMQLQYMHVLHCNFSFFSIHQVKMQNIHFNPFPPRLVKTNPFIILLIKGLGGKGLMGLYSYQAFSFDVCDRTCYLSHAWIVIFSRKGLVHRIILLSILHLCLRAPSLNNAVYVNSISQALITTARRPPKAKVRFCRVSSCRFSVSVFLWEPPKPVLYTILNVKFLPFV